MQHARCTTDGEIWEAELFSQLELSTLEDKRLNLVCVECGKFAWFRKASKHGHPAHFCAHHDPECNLKVEYVIVDDPRNQVTEEVDEVAPGDTMIVRLDEEKGGDVDVTEVQSPPSEGSGLGGRTFVIKRQGRESSQQFTLRRILHRLVQSPGFRESDNHIVLYRKEQEVLISGSVRDIVCNFDNISKEVHDEKRMLYWGPIASAGLWKDGRIWLNSGKQYYNSASVVIFANIADEFLKMFNIEDLEDLAGAYVLVAGICHFTKGGEGKPAIWCGSSRFITVRKYRASNLQVPGNI